MEIVVYLVGVVLLGVFYQPVKSALGGGVPFVSVVIGYLLLLRLIGYGIRRYTHGKSKAHD